jgi:uncharacterized protein YdeI (YjbR/CyaY-like superfamily)
VTASYPQVEITSRAQWRGWLAEHHAAAPGAWLVLWKRGREGYVDYEDLIEEALCFGWVDSQARGLDADRGQLLMTPRRPRGTWARTNKERVARLTEAGLMAPAGLAAVAAAKANGSWTVLDDVEDLIEPEDLRAALDASPPARQAWDGFPPSGRKSLLGWIATARTAPTRERRIATTVSEAAQGRRADQPKS